MPTKTIKEYIEYITNALANIHCSPFKKMPTKTIKEYMEHITNALAYTENIFKNKDEEPEQLRQFIKDKNRVAIYNLEQVMEHT